jgi:hypothetical protein
MIALLTASAKSADLGRVALRHQDKAELVAGKPCQRVLRLQEAAQTPGEGDEDVVAGGDAERVVDLLVAVDVDGQHRRAHSVRACGE